MCIFALSKDDNNGTTLNLYTMKTKIYYPDSIFGGLKCEEKDLTRKEILDLRQSIRRNMTEWFTWDSYNEKFRHLVISAEFADVVVIYTNGYLMTEDEFETKVATRKDILFADVKHRI